MQLHEIKIRNFKQFEDIRIEFSDQFNLIVGDNGVGKTSVLEAILVALGGFLSGIDGVKSMHFTRDEIRRKSISYGDASIETEYELPIEVVSDLSVEGRSFVFSRQKRKVASARSTIEPRDITHYAASMIKDLDKIMPVISYQGILRVGSQIKEKWNDPFDKKSVRMNGYIDCLNSASDMKMITNWCRRMDHISLQRGAVVTEYRAVTNAVGAFMKKMFDSGETVQIYYDASEGEIVYKKDGQVLPLRMLSSGFRTLVGMVMNIAYRMAVLNPFLRQAITTQTDGIVLIDELDMHLHPKWQWRVVSALKETFPRVQFIVTTHSPQIISSMSETDKIISLSGQEQNSNTPCYLDAPKGWLVGDILQEKMGTSNRTPEVAAQLSRLQVLGRKRAKKEATDTELAEYRRLIDSLRTLLPEGDLSIEEAAFFSVEDLLGTGQ